MDERSFQHIIRNGFDEIRSGYLHRYACPFGGIPDVGVVGVADDFPDRLIWVSVHAPAEQLGKLSNALVVNSAHPTH